MEFQKIVYRVLEDDTKNGICKKFGISCLSFIAQNGAEELREGMLVLIPCSFYVVCPGDSISSIANYFGINEKNIKSNNNNLSVIFIGQKLKI